MRIFVAGATGAIGRPLIRRLVARGHEVAGMTRSRADAVRALGAVPIEADALDAEAVGAAVARARPEVVVHQLTALSGRLDLRRFDRSMAETNRLRTQGADHLLAAAQAVGARRFVAQSYTGWPYARTGGPVKTEADPLDPSPPGAMREALAAIRHLEAAVTAAPGGVVLRYGALYGPGTSLGEGGEHLEAVRRRRFPLAGPGTGIWSFLHVDDAAAATVAAIEREATGVFNIVDDEPAAVAEWLPELARAVGAKPPRRVPLWVARLLVGPAGVGMMTDIRGAANTRAKRELGWQPRWASWRDGFREGLAIKREPLVTA